MKLIGLTGGIATGKSTVSKMLRDLRIPVIDADELAREVVETQTFGLRAIIENFGTEMLESGGGLNRGKLADLIFKEEESRRRLERITHPLIQWRAVKEQEFYRGAGEAILFYDAALIFEKNLVQQFDSILVVYTSPEIQVKRLVSRDKLSTAEAEKRIASQIPITEKVKQANYTIDNDGTLELTRHQVTKLVEKLNSRN